MGWLYVPESEASNSDSPSPSPDTALFVTSSGKPTLRRHSWRGWETRPWLRLLSGTILPPSTARRGVAEWISSLPVCPASPTPSPGSVEATRTSEPSGQPLSGSSRRCAPPWCSSRTSQRSFSFSDPSERLYRDWATGLRLEYSRRPRSGRPTGGSGCSSSQDEYPAPSACEYGTNQGEAKAWQTPTVADVEGGRMSRSGARSGELLLKGQAAHWPTATAQDAKSSGAAAYSTESGRHAGVTLTDATRAWSTPSATDHKGSTRPGQRKRQLSEAAECPSSHPAPEATGQASRPSSSRRSPTGPWPHDAFYQELAARLNPRFVEWLMGLPRGWTDFAPVGTESYLFRQRMHLLLLFGG